MTDLPAPLVPADCDLRRYRKMPIDIVRLQSSDIQMECRPEEKWFAFELWMAAFHQVPAASLPDEDAKLAYMAGLSRDKRTWNRVKATALRGFVKCSDGRLYHPVLADICLEVWETMKGRKRGANTTNEKRSKSQGSDNKGNTKRSATRSIYSERDDQRTDSDTLQPRSPVATEGVGIPPPISPPETEAGSGYADAPPARPSTPTEPAVVTVTLASGAVLEIDANLSYDEVYAPLDCPKTSLTKAELLELRRKALKPQPAVPLAAVGLAEEIGRSASKSEPKSAEMPVKGITPPPAYDGVRDMPIAFAKAPAVIAEKQRAAE